MKLSICCKPSTLAFFDFGINLRTNKDFNSNNYDTKYVEGYKNLDDL